MEQEVVWDFNQIGQAVERFDLDQTASIAKNTEASLIHAAQHGDLSAFNRLVLIHQDSLYGWVFSLVLDNALADDITQTVFITAFEKIKTFRGGSFKAWLFTIAKNRSFDELRQMKRSPVLSLDGDQEDDWDRMEVLPSTDHLPEEVLLASERAAAIEQLVNRLPYPYQQVVRLVDMEGMDYQEAASMLRLPLGTVKSRLARARLKMRDLLQKRIWL